MATQEALVDILLPRRFLFYLVANVGQGGSYRPLAVALIDASCNYSGPESEGYSVFSIILRLMNVLSDPANRLAIQEELQLAKILYGDGRHDPSRTTLLDFNVEMGEHDPWGLFDTDDHLEEKEKPQSPDIAQFPFLSTCLFLGPGPLTLRPLSQSVSLLSLGTEFHDDNIEPIGMVVLDISDPTRDGLRYGIISFSVRQMADVHVHDDDQGWDPVEDEPPLNDPVPTLDAIRPRTPQSASACILNRGIDRYQHAIQELDQRPLVDGAALDFIWPVSDSNSDKVDDSAATQVPVHKSKSLRDQSILSLIDGTQSVDRYDMTAFEEPLQLPDFRTNLLRLLQEEPERIGPTWAAGQVLSIAYSNREHLDWVVYKGLSADSIAAALGSPDIAQAKSLTLCIDLSRDPAAKIVEALSRSSNLREIALLQDPARVDDRGIGEIFEALSASTDESVRRLLDPDVQLVVAGAYSAALRKQPWLRLSNPHRFSQAFPVQQLLLRREPQRIRQPGEDVEWKKDHFFLGDALLRPQHFAGGLLQFLASVERDELVSCFSSGAPSLSNLSRCAISPVPAEYYSTIGATTEHQQLRGGDAPNRLRGISAHSWTALVSQGWHVDYETEKYHRGTRIYNQAKFKRYALVRARKPIAIVDKELDSSSSSSSMAPKLALRPEDIEIQDLKGFLQATLPEHGNKVDLTLVDKSMDKAAHLIANENWRRGWESEMGLEIRCLSLMEGHEVYSMLQDFVEMG